jgi:choline-sulfatase
LDKIQKPNLLYIHSDQHNPFVTGCYGDPLVQTPNLDQLAKQGTVFENAYCPSPICVPSRMATLTGCYPYQNRVWTNDHILDSGTPTFAHAMGAAGYRPILIGRMHAVGPDQLHGYAERIVGDHGPNHIGGRKVDLGILDGTAGPDRISLLKSGSGRNAYHLHDEYVTLSTIEYLNRMGMERKHGLNREPFCLSVGFMLPHQPFVCTEEDYHMYHEKMTLPIHPEATHARHPAVREWMERTGISSVSKEEIIRARAAYWGLVTRMDHMIGRILDTLRANGLNDNTLIIYTSDHGEQAGEHGLWWKQTFYEASVRIPMIISWPGVIPQDHRCKRVVSSLDLNATMLDALQAPPLPRSAGRSMLPMLTKPETDATWNDEAYSEYCTDTGEIHRMIRKNHWKLIYYHGHNPQLFHMKNDPHELNDRSQDPDCQSVLQELQNLVLADWIPEKIAVDMDIKRKENNILSLWARETKPEDVCRWTLTPDMSMLD